MRTLIYSALALLLAVSEVLAGASFDCTKAASPVEILICGDAALSEADSRLAQAYHKAIQAESTPSVLRSEQRAWLKERSRYCRLPERPQTLMRGWRGRAWLGSIHTGNRFLMSS